MGEISNTFKIWGIILVLLIIFLILSMLHSANNNKFNSLLIINKPVNMKQTKQLNLNKYEKNLNDFLGNTTQMTILTWLFIAPVNKDNLRASNDIMPLTNILCKGQVNNPLPLILFNHYTDSIYIYMAISGSTTTNLLNQINKYGNSFWIDLEQNPQNYPNIYIIPNILVGRWFQFGIIVNGQILEIYINSKLSKSIILQNTVITDSNQNRINIGPINNGSIRIEGLKGEIAQLRFYPKILSIREIHKIYEKGLNQGVVEGWAVKKSEWIGDKADKYIMPIPDKLKNIGKNIGTKSLNAAEKLGKNIIDSKIFQDAEKGLGKGLAALTKGDIGNRMLYGNTYKQSVPYLSNDETLLSNICTKNGYIPNPLPSRETIGDDRKQCNNDCDCFGVDKCNMKTYSCNSSLEYKLQKPINNKDLNCVVSQKFTNNNSEDAIETQNTICNKFTSQNCPENCYTSGNCDGTVLTNHDSIDSANLPKLNVRPVNSYTCNYLCSENDTCTDAIYNKSLESCYSNGGNKYCTVENSDITISKIGAKNNVLSDTKNCCIQYAKENDVDQSKGDMTRIVNSWDNIPYGCVSSKIDSDNKDERYVWYNTNQNSTASLGPNQQMVDKCSNK